MSDGEDVDGDIPHLLEEWGLPQYIHTFQENNITIPILSMLDKSLVKELIPPIGDRAKFLKNLDNWNRLTNPEGCPEIPSDISSCSAGPVFVDMLNPRHKQIKSVSEFIIPLNNDNTSTQQNDSDVIILATTREDQVATTSEDQVATTNEDQDMTVYNEDACLETKTCLWSRSACDVLTKIPNVVVTLLTLCSTYFYYDTRYSQESLDVVMKKAIFFKRRRTY